MSKKNRKRRSMIAVILLIAFLITGCEDKSVKTDHIIRIGVVTYTQDDPFINAMTDQLKENLKKMETDHMKIITTVKNGDDNQQDQNEIVEEMIDAGCDVLCVNLVDRTAPSRIIRMAKQEDIPVLFFNREPVREDLMQWEKLYYIGCNAEQSGIMQGEIVADYIKNHPEVDKNQDGKIQYILLEGEAGHQDAISRTDYSVKTLLEQGIDLETLKEDQGMSDVDDFDFICHVAFDKKPLTRKERAENVKKRDFLNKYSGAAREVLEALLDKYMNTGNIETGSFYENVKSTEDSFLFWR